MLAASFAAETLGLSPQERLRLDELYRRHQSLAENLSTRRPDRALIEEFRKLAPLAALYAPLLTAIREGNRQSMRELSVRIRSLLESFAPEVQTAEAPELVLAGRFEDGDLESFVRTGDDASRFPWSRYRRMVLREIHEVLQATSLDDVKRRCGGLKHYKGGARYAGWYAVEIDKQWRVLFVWEEGRAARLFIADYHND